MRESSIGNRFPRRSFLAARLRGTCVRGPGGALTSISMHRTCPCSAAVQSGVVPFSLPWVTSARNATSSCRQSECPPSLAMKTAVRPSACPRPSTSVRLLRRARLPRRASIFVKSLCSEHL